MSLPGPPVGTWALGLLFWAAAAALLGELVRLFGGRYIPAWRRPELLERGLTDFYLGGAVLYLVAAVPFGWFVSPVLYALPLLAVTVLAANAVLRQRTVILSRGLAALRSLARPTYLTVLLSAAAVYAFEVALAAPVPTGNTFDSGLLTTYTALLVRNHSIPLSFQPYATPGILYPQGTTVWLGWAQGVLALPPARTSLMVTPLFIALAPVAGFVLGCRLFASERAGLAIALMLAWLAPATRGMVAGSNDFVFAFPLVLVLAGETVDWFRSQPPVLANAFGFGLLAGYSAALNPVGAEWLFPTIVVGGLVARPAFGGRFRRWILGWVVALGTALLAVVPSLYVLVQGYASPEFVPGAAAPPAGYPTGISTSQFLGSIDPFLFRPQDVQLSPVPALRLELAILIALGLAVLIVVGRGSALAGYLASFRTFAFAAGVSLIGWLALLWAASTGSGALSVLGRVTSAGELSTWLMTLYVLVAAIPLLLALERLSSTWPARSPVPAAPTSERKRRRLGSDETARTLLPLAVALVVVVPGVALTPTALAPVLSQYYQDLGNVTAGDFALLDYAGSHLPSGARVLIAPGSAADFLPGYAANVVLLYPLIPGWPWVNSSYHLVVGELSNATLNASGRAALSALNVEYIIVTGNSTALWPAFSPAPLLADPSTFPVLFHDGDAYLFARIA